MLDINKIRAVLLDDYDKLEDLGISSFSLYECAYIICENGYYNGNINVSCSQTFPSFSESFYKILEKPILEMTNRLIEAIHKGVLQALIIKRNPDESIIPESTIIELSVLEKWAEERSLLDFTSEYNETVGYYCGDLFGAAESAIENERLKYKFPEKFKHANNKVDFEILKISHENSRLNETIEQLESKVEELEAAMNVNEKDKPLTTREKDTLLKMIVAMAIDVYGYNPDSPRGNAVKDIENALLEIGMAVSQDTIRTKLKEAKELLPQDWQKP